MNLLKLFFRVDPQSVELTKAKMQPWDDTNKTEDEKLTAWMVAENGRSNHIFLSTEPLLRRILTAVTYK